MLRDGWPNVEFRRTSKTMCAISCQYVDSESANNLLCHV